MALFFCSGTVTFFSCRGLPVEGFLPRRFTMTNEQREMITAMRHKQLSYTTISRELGLSVNTVKSFCRRNGMMAEKSSADIPRCKNCGEVINTKSGVKPRLFCSSHCKQTWWNKHRHDRVSKCIISHVCPTCGKSFTDYSGANRKYCSQACYRERNRHNGA